MKKLIKWFNYTASLRTKILISISIMQGLVLTFFACYVYSVQTLIIGKMSDNEAERIEYMKIFLPARVSCIVVALVMILLSVVISDFLISVVIKRLKKLEHQADGVASGDMEAIPKTDAVDEIGAVTNSISVMADNLKEKAAQAKAADSTKTDFLARMSHDIRTPMNAIIGLTTIAEKNVKDSQYVSDNLKKIKLASNHLLTLINDILDISKVERGKISLSPVIFSIVDSAENLVNISQPVVRQKNIDFRFRSKNITHEYLYADQLRINQIFINILSNALKYTPENKQVYVDLCEEKSEQDNHIKLVYKVADTGIGMTESFMQIMYEPFMRQTDSRINSIQGTGLGLAITKKMVDLMGGTIECESAPGMGTTFTVTLDIEVSSKAENEKKLPPIEVLVIDDDEVLLETACDTLKALGTTAERAESGQKALEKLLAKKQSDKSYDVIIMDWKMPGINGVELTKKIRRIAGDDISILLVSAYDWTQIEDDAKQAGINGFISKPLFRSSLFKKISEVLGLEKDAPSREENNSDLAGMNVLVAEDMDVNWEVISTLLEMYQIKSCRAENGKAAVEMLKNIRPGEYDAVFMDIQMPVMNGLDATREIRRLPNPYAAGIPVIAMTADAFSENVTECLEAGMNGHIAKPIDINNVLRELRKIRQAGPDFTKTDDFTGGDYED
jgi:signal transduction histidine kinase/DNA-binding response OmpR family regulator